MHALILGPTGTAGSAVLTQTLAHPKIHKVTVLSRRPTGVHHPNLTEVIQTDFVHYDSLASLFATIDVCFFCLGISQLKEKDRTRFFQITHDYPVALAKALLLANPSVTFCFLSGQGADPSGKSNVAFAKAKGAAENSLKALGLKQLYIFRPGYIHPEQARSDRPIGEKVSGFLYPVIRHIFPRFIIRANQLADGIIHVGVYGYPEKLLDNQMIKAVTQKAMLVDQS